MSVLGLQLPACDRAPEDGAEARASSQLSRLEARHPELFAAPRAGAPRALATSVPARADGAASLADVAGKLELQLERLGAPAVAAVSVGDWHVYPAGAGLGSTVLARATGDAYEERVVFERAPDAPELSHAIELSDASHGLRLVAATLELLDASGAPRLRLAPPLLVSAAGGAVPVALEVEGCAVEHDPAPPWGQPHEPAGADTCRLRVTWEPGDVTFPAVLGLRWSATTEPTLARERFALATLAGGLVLVAGGLSATGQALAAAELYDATSGTWATTSSLAVARAEHTLSVLRTGRALAAGGRAAAGLLDGVELYDPVTGLWLGAPPLPSPRAAHAALVLGNGDVLLAGGEGAPEALRFSGVWTHAGELLAAEPGATLSPLPGGRALLVGPEPPAAQIYEPSANRWSEAPPPALPRAGHTATALANGRVLIVGGHAFGNAASPSRSAELFEPATLGWQRVGATRDARAFHTATTLANKRVLIVGGRGAEGSELYDPAWGTWAPGPALLAPRLGHGAALLADGTVLVVGGAAASAPEPEPGAPTPDAGSAAPDAGRSPPLGGVLGSAERLAPSAAPPVTTEYKLPARLDRGVTSNAVTELWAAVTRPAALESERRYPLIVMFAGNHATCGTGSSPRQDSDCSYTHTGRCPEGFSVVASHRGLDYLATELAARGYIVVSINANRGLNCGDGEDDDWSMNLARGRLLLRHLERLAEWHRGAQRTPGSLGVSLEGRLDLSEVGVLGHSRGGEAARAAYQQYRDPGSPWPARIGDPLSLRAIFEIAPVDGQAPRRLDPDGVAWAALLPMCDGDVSDLQGTRPFDRTFLLGAESPPAPKALLTAWGANHNFFNTQWQVSDSSGCTGHRPLFGAGQGSAEQRQVALAAVLDFFRSHVGGAFDQRLGARFDPAVGWPSETRIDRGFVPGVAPEHGLSLEDFRGRSGAGKLGLPHVSRGLRLVHSGVPEHDPSARAAFLRWQAGGAGERFLELRFAEPASAGLDLGAYDYLDFRVDRGVSPDNPSEPTPLHVQLVGAEGAASPALDVSAYGVRLDGPFGGPDDNLHSMLQTVRLPLGDFGAERARAVHGVRFGLPGAAGGALFIADVRASVDRARVPRGEPAAGSGPSPAPPPQPAPLVAAAERVGAGGVPGVGNRVRTLVARGAEVEIELVSAEPFVVQDDALVLELGGQRSYRSRHPDGDLRRVIFKLEAPGFTRLQDGAPLRVRAATSRARVWDFGALDRSRWRR